MKILNSEVDQDWEECPELSVKEVAHKFLNPILESSSIEDTARRELEKVL